MFDTIYVRGIIGIAAIAGTVCYLGSAEGLTEFLGAIVGIVYIDKALSGNNDNK